MSVITQPTDLLRRQDPQMADVLAGSGSVRRARCS